MASDIWTSRKITTSNAQHLEEKKQRNTIAPPHTKTPRFYQHTSPKEKKILQNIAQYGASTIYDLRIFLTHCDFSRLSRKCVGIFK